MTDMNEIRIEFDHGDSGIVLKADGTSETWGRYSPDKAATEFWFALATLHHEKMRVELEALADAEEKP